MRRHATLVAAFVGGWAAMVLVLAPLYEPRILEDYARVAAMGCYLAVAGLVVYVAVLHQAIYRHRTRPMMSPRLVWGMGVSYVLAAGMAALSLWERLGAPLTYRPFVLALSLALALCWLVPLVRHLLDTRA